MEGEDLQQEKDPRLMISMCCVRFLCEPIRRSLQYQVDYTTLLTSSFLFRPHTPTHTHTHTNTHTHTQTPWLTQPSHPRMGLVLIVMTMSRKTLIDPVLVLLKSISTQFRSLIDLNVGQASEEFLCTPLVDFTTEIQHSCTCLWSHY